MVINPRQYDRLMDRLRKAAEQEASSILAALPDEFRERVRGLRLRFHDRPSAEMVRQGGDPDQLSMTDGQARETHIFLMNIHDRHARFLGDFRHELRRRILMELAAYADVEMDLGD